MFQRIILVAFLSSLSLPVSADETAFARVSRLDSLNPTEKFVTLAGFSDPRCDENRILMRSPDQEQRTAIFTMLLSALIAGNRVQIQFQFDGMQCVGSRVIMELP